MRLLLIVLLLSFWACANNNAEKTYNEGAQLYQKHCENCHMEDGKGLEALYPPLAQSDMLESMGVGAACIIVNGLSGKVQVNGTEYEMDMPPVKGLTPVEVTNILNYIHNAWGNKRDFIQLNEVQQLLKSCAPDKK